MFKRRAKVLRVSRYKIATSPASASASQKNAAVSIRVLFVRRLCRRHSFDCRNHCEEKSIMTENTVKLHRVIRAPAERIYRAFLDADAMAKWLPPHGFTGKVHQIKAEVGGTYRMSFTNHTTGHSHSFGGEFLELVPNERIRHTDKFDDPNLPGQMQTTISLKTVSVGTELTVVQEGIPNAIPVEACYLGWQESLTLLAQLVEAEIKQ
jgi:uncharacterized protein YndB with AHSA1/START domain